MVEKCCATPVRLHYADYQITAGSQFASAPLAVLPRLESTSRTRSPFGHGCERKKTPPPPWRMNDDAAPARILSRRVSATPSSRQSHFIPNIYSQAPQELAGILPHGTSKSGNPSHPLKSRGGRGQPRDSGECDSPGLSTPLVTFPSVLFLSAVELLCGERLRAACSTHQEAHRDVLFLALSSRSGAGPAKLAHFSEPRHVDGAHAARRSRLRRPSSCFSSPWGPWR